MPRIENCSMEEVRTGDHTVFAGDTILIQITDPAYYPPVPLRDFVSVFQFEFLDLDDSDIDKHGENRGFEEFAVSQRQADSLVEILQGALARDQDVIVHCHAGVSRSGAVVEVGEIMGFEPCSRFRAPNLRVKHKMMSALNLSFDPNESPFMKNLSDSESVDKND